MADAQKQRPWTPARSAQLREALTHRKFSNETREKIRQARLRQHPQPKRDTSIEIALQDALRALGLEFLSHASVCGICIPDIVFPEHKVAVFADGDYWHSLPAAVKRDKAQNSALPRQGWLPIRVRESSIKRNVAGCATEIQNILLQAANRDSAVFL
jgi:G:T-mismatch repair DNA endonuclease (very short patch repair protein)